MSDRLSRLASLTGIPFGILVFIGFALSSNSPDSNASGEKVIAFYVAHKSDQTTSDFLFVFAYIFFLFFAGSLRGYLRRTPAAETLSALMLAGATLLVAGIAIFSGLDLALSDQPSRLTPGAAQALNLLNADMFFPVAIGGGVFGISAGLAILRGAALPKWLGWVAVVIGIVSVSPGFFFAFIASFVWVVIVSILLYLRSGPVTAAPAPAAPVATSV